MKKTNRAHVGIAIRVVILLIVAAKYFDAFTVQQTPQSSSKTKLETARGLAEGTLQDIDGKITIGPYRELWQQRYQFLGTPNNLQFRLYNFTLTDAKRLFHERAANGAKIQGIMESQQYASKDNQFADLHEGFLDNKNITIIPDERLGIEFQHAKTFLTDSSFIMQTANMTYSSFNKNREVFFMSSHTGVLASLHSLFYNDRRGLPTATDALHPNLIVCPINCRDRIESLLQSATHSIYMYQQYIADDRIQHILQQQKEKGRDIKLILGDKKDGGDTRDKPFLDAFTGHIKMQSDPYVHAKVILVDNEFLLIGSMNMSDTSMNKNREIGILLLNRYQIEKMMNMFMKDWSR